MKTVLITGANRGIGLEHARRFAERGVHVYATARSPENAVDLQGLARAHPDRVTVLPYDAHDTAAAAKLKAALGDAPVDLLLANAGSMGGKNQAFGSVDAQDVLDLIRVNTLAPLKLAEALADNVARSQRKVIAFQTSRMGSIGGNDSSGSYAYRISKAALNMVAKNVAIDLKARGIIVVALHPGWVRTRMGGQGAPVAVQASVAGQQRLIDSLTPEHNGRFFTFDGTELPW